MLDVPKVYRCLSWLMCCKSNEHWPEMIETVHAEVRELPADDETRTMVRQLAAARKAELDG